MPEVEINMYHILSILNEKVQPLGSGLLRQLLLEKGLELSEATVGRTLIEMDRIRLTQKVGFKGREITEKGKEKLTEITNLRKRTQFGNRFVEALQATRIEDLLEVLLARRAIEREIARLAALRATEKEIKALDAILAEQEKYFSGNLLLAEHDYKFHKLIAAAAKNKVLEAALDLIRHDSQLSPILEYIRKQVGGKLVVGHFEIMKGIRARDSEQAEKAMVAHIESLIGDVNNYWSKTRVNTTKY